MMSTRTTALMLALKHADHIRANPERIPGPAPMRGTNPHAFAQGDELIINDQLTTTHKVNGGYPIVGHDAGVCTLTRIPEPHA
jgi:hypothetical protein